MKGLMTLAIVLATLAAAPATNAMVYLHGIGPYDNPPTLYLDNSEPTGTTPKFNDSPAVKFQGGNQWKEIGTWATPSIGTLTDLNNLHVWVGLKDWDDLGTRFDLRAEVYKDEEMITFGETLCITDLYGNPKWAKKVVISFERFSPVFFSDSDVLSLRIMTRIGSNPDGSRCRGHGRSSSRSEGLRLYFDSVNRPSRFEGTFETTIIEASEVNAPPHLIYGKVFNSGGTIPQKDHLATYAYVLSRPEEGLNKSSVGCGYEVFPDGGWMWFEAGNFPSSWSINENLRIIAIDTNRGESGVIDLLLDASGSQLLSDLTLQPGDRVGPIAYDSKVDGANPASIPQGKKSVTLTARIDDSFCGNNNIQWAEYFMDTDPGLGSGIPLSPQDGAYDSPKEDVKASIDTSTWVEGETHAIYVCGQDIGGNWGTTHVVSILVTKPQKIRGDIDGDGDVDIVDLIILLRHLRQPASACPDCDLDGDGSITRHDAKILIHLCTRPFCAPKDLKKCGH